MIIDLGTKFVCEKFNLKIIDYISDKKGRTGSILKDEKGNLVVLQCVDYLLFKSNGIYKSITIELIDYAFEKKAKFLLYVQKGNLIWELDANKIKTGYEQEKRYFRGINMYYINLKEVVIKTKNEIKKQEKQIKL